MADKWSKKKAIEYITQLRSPLETEQQTLDPIERLRQAVQKSKGMIIPQREM